MSLTMNEVDDFIDTAIDRLSSEEGRTVSHFYVDLRSYQQRITLNLVDQCTKICESRGLIVDRQGDGLHVIVNLNSCLLNPRQAKDYSTALAYTREIHGNQL